MAKNIRRILARVMVMAMFVTVLPVQTLAAETNTVTETTTETNGGLTTNVETKTEKELDENGNVVRTFQNPEAIIKFKENFNNAVKNHLHIN